MNELGIFTLSNIITIYAFIGQLSSCSVQAYHFKNTVKINFSNRSPRTQKFGIQIPAALDQSRKQGGKNSAAEH